MLIGQVFDNSSGSLVRAWEQLLIGRDPISAHHVLRLFKADLTIAQQAIYFHLELVLFFCTCGGRIHSMTKFAYAGQSCIRWQRG